MSQKSNITWTLEALQDFEDYKDWYLENSNVSVTNSFIETIEAAIDLISKNNHIARMVNEIPDLREYVVGVFPFLISYWIKNNKEIVITSFLHQKMKK
jgi:plasmid stabilization system protein ParE